MAVQAGDKDFADAAMRWSSPATKRGLAQRPCSSGTRSSAPPNATRELAAR
jgi:hypothetical protein